MDLALSEEQELIRETFAGFFSNESSLELVRECEPLGFSADLWKKFAETGALGMGVPESLGGGGTGLLEMALVAEECGRQLAPVPFVESAVAARLLARLEAPDALEAALEDAAPLALALRLVDDSPGQRIPAGAVAGSVLALRGGALVRVSRPPGWEPDCPKNHGSAPIASWPLAEAPGEVLAEGERARAEFDTAVEEWKLLTAAALVGLGRESVRLGAEYAKGREQFGAPIGSYQGIAHPLADCATAVDGAQLLVWEAVWAREDEPERAPALASMAFAFAAEAAARAATVSLHTHGGYGFSLEYDVQLYFRRARAWPLVWDDPRRELQRLADRLYGPARS